MQWVRVRVRIRVRDRVTVRARARARVKVTVRVRVSVRNCRNRNLCTQSAVWHIDTWSLFHISRLKYFKSILTR